MTLIRPRRPDDVPALVEVLTEQQPESRYPLRWPLPFPVERFLVRDTEDRSWVAEVDGAVAGHVTIARVEGELADRFAAALGPVELASVSVLFVAREAQGLGIGGLLLDTAVAEAVRQGRLPVLDVAPSHSRALAVYRRRGWTELARVRPHWLPEGEDDVVLMALRPGPGTPAGPGG